MTTGHTVDFCLSQTCSRSLWAILGSHWPRRTPGFKLNGLISTNASRPELSGEQHEFCMEGGRSTSTSTCNPPDSPPSISASMMRCNVQRSEIEATFSSCKRTYALQLWMRSRPENTENDVKRRP